MTLRTAYRVLVDMLAIRQDCLPPIDYVQLDIIANVVRIVQHLTSEKMLIFARVDIIVQKVRSFDSDNTLML